MQIALFLALSQPSLWQSFFIWAGLKRLLSKPTEMTGLTGQRENSLWVKCFFTVWAWLVPLP